ncbi:MAG TPA: hypothetical protein VGI60_07880 [Chthoniobacterales bacterium]
MGFLVESAAKYWHRFCFSFSAGMHATFFQKVILCMVAGFFAASLLMWGKVFVEGADDALNGSYRKKDPSIVSH